jgi:hypothetical protein
VMEFPACRSKKYHQFLLVVIYRRERIQCLMNSVESFN